MPKDGPSAGITMCTALVSALTGITVRHDIAMTGEITLRGNVLPIGGLKEKALAAHRAEIFEIIIPADNEKDLEEIPKSISKVMTFYPVNHIDEVLRHALNLEDPEEFFSRRERSEYKLDLAYRPGGEGEPGDGDVPSNTH